MHTNTQKGFVNGLHLYTNLYQTPVSQPGMDFTGPTLETYSSAGHPYPSSLIHADIPTSAPGSSWAYDGLSAHSEPAMSSTSWTTSYQTAMPVSAGDASCLVGGVYGWDALQSYPSNCPATDDTETVSSNPFSTDSAMFDAGSTTTQPTAFSMDYASQSSGSSIAGPPFLSTPPPTFAYNTSSASSPSGARSLPRRVKSNPRMRVKRETTVSSSSTSSRKRKQESKQKQTQSQSLYPGDLPMPMAERNLLARYAHRIPSSPGMRMMPDHVRREAWRICEAEAREMSERRKLLEHEGGALERETAKLQISVGAMREAVAREQRELERAVEIAERLSSSC